MRTLLQILGCLVAALALVSCQVGTPHQAGRKEALRTNAISNKHRITESPTLERAAPTLPPGP
ncbi:MAG: hypothetical protein ACRYG7_29250 [Janthinobacterium lividum]